MDCEDVKFTFAEILNDGSGFVLALCVPCTYSDVSKSWFVCWGSGVIIAMSGGGLGASVGLWESIDEVDE